MDHVDKQNIPPLQGEPPNSPFIVTLDTWQYFRYQTYFIEIYSPDGRLLETIGKAINNDTAEDAVHRLRDQVALVGCLLGNINDSVNLSIPAVLGLTDLFSQMELRLRK